MEFQRARLCVRVLALLSLSVFVIGCAATRPAPPRPEPAPPLIEVDGATLPAIVFANVKLDIPDHVAIGYHHVGAEYTRDSEYRWGPHFKEETDKLNGSGQALLAEAGYRVVAADPAALRLVGTLGRFSYNSYAHKASFEQAECEVIWELHRPGEAKPCFAARTSGAGRIEAGQIGGIMAAFELALRRLLADEQFVAAVRGAGGAG